MSIPTRRVIRLWASTLGFGLGLVLGCVRADCSNGSCACPVGASCEFECDAPPCHVECEGDNPEGECGNGECACGPGSNCTFECQSPPCHVDCEADSTCVGACANGDCTCEQGSACQFECDAGPCHVECAGSNANCDGTCANGTCRCGPGSSCDFVCADNNCAVQCEAGSSCTLSCAQGEPGGQGCRFDTCAAGEPTPCPDGVTLVCGDAACPA